MSRRGRYADKLLQFSLRWDVPFRHKSHKHTLRGRGRAGCAPARRHMLGDLFTALRLVQDQHPVKAPTDSRTRACVSPELASRIYIYIYVYIVRDGARGGTSSVASGRRCSETDRCLPLSDSHPRLTMSFARWAPGSVRAHRSSHKHFSTERLFVCACVCVCCASVYSLSFYLSKIRWSGNQSLMLRPDNNSRRCRAPAIITVRP